MISIDPYSSWANAMFSAHQRQKDFAESAPRRFAQLAAAQASVERDPEADVRFRQAVRRINHFRQIPWVHRYLEGKWF